MPSEDCLFSVFTELSLLLSLLLLATAISFVSKSKQIWRQFLKKTLNMVTLRLSVIASADGTQAVRIKKKLLGIEQRFTKRKGEGQPLCFNANAGPFRDAA